MFLETIDGVAILGYAGLGATIKGTEPADWMSAVLRGRKLPLEKSLGVLASALQKQFPRHLSRMVGPNQPAHSVFIPAFMNDEPRFYSIDIAFAPNRKTYNFRYIRHIVGTTTNQSPRTPRLSIGGSGLAYLVQDKKWIRELLHVVRAHDNLKIPATAVTDYLATLNYKVHLGLTNNSVGPRCIVAWRHKKSGVHKGGGGQRYYTGTTADSDAPIIPAISNGLDVQAFLGIVTPHMLAAIPQKYAPGAAPQIDVDALNANLARLPKEPNEELI